MDIVPATAASSSWGGIQGPMAAASRSARAFQLHLPFTTRSFSTHPRFIIHQIDNKSTMDNLYPSMLCDLMIHRFGRMGTIALSPGV